MNVLYSASCFVYASFKSSFILIIVVFVLRFEVEVMLVMFVINVV